MSREIWFQNKTQKPENYAKPLIIISLFIFYDISLKPNMKTISINFYNVVSVLIKKENLYEFFLLYKKGRNTYEQLIRLILGSFLPSCVLSWIPSVNHLVVRACMSHVHGSIMGIPQILRYTKNRIIPAFDKWESNPYPPWYVFLLIWKETLYASTILQAYRISFYINIWPVVIY